jgi:hypothetical protein
MPLKMIDIPRAPTPRFRHEEDIPGGAHYTRTSMSKVVVRGGGQSATEPGGTAVGSTRVDRSMISAILSHHEALKFDRRSSPTQFVLQPPVTASNLLPSALLSNLILIAIKHAQQGGNDLEQRI